MSSDSEPDLASLDEAAAEVGAYGLPWSITVRGVARDAVAPLAALVLADQQWTYAEAEADANRVANLLVHRGIRPGDRVALACPNLPAFPAIYFGIFKAGAVVVPMNVLLRHEEMAYHLADSGATAYFCFAGTDAIATGAEGLVAFEQTPGRQHFFVIPAGQAV